MEDVDYEENSETEMDESDLEESLETEMEDSNFEEGPETEMEDSDIGNIPANIVDGSVTVENPVANTQNIHRRRLELLKKMMISLNRHQKYYNFLLPHFKELIEVYSSAMMIYMQFFSITDDLTRSRIQSDIVTVDDHLRTLNSFSKTIDGNFLYMHSFINKMTNTCVEFRNVFVNRSQKQENLLKKFRREAIKFGRAVLNIIHDCSGIVDSISNP